MRAFKVLVRTCDMPKLVRSVAASSSRNGVALTIALFLCFYGLLGSAGAEDSQESGVLHDGFRLTRNVRPALCTSLLAQARLLYQKHQSLCNLPLDGADELALIEWLPIKSSEAEQDLRANLPFTGFATSQLYRALKKERPNATAPEIASLIWDEHGTAMLKALDSDPANLATAIIDVDGDQILERAYRIAMLDPVPEAMDKPAWQARSCTLPGEAPASPAYSIVFEQSARGRLGTLDNPHALDRTGLFLFRGRVYSLLRSSTTVSVFEHKLLPENLGDGRAYRDQICDITNY